ncbi:Retrovirus-related Pol polyprotein from transposon RE2 [Vitis vinifera]|uniref:Retrovirus-related Pol polyprotein from transposon RE2 n=1 Tax=Vitis vinifera TaxID=29760 RepID=A0A438CSM9_VITVI|nr:Retrovirus-related Pol polyprotein from transposon RE2 [Vitis vinifera]
MTHISDLGFNKLHDYVMVVGKTCILSEAEANPQSIRGCASQTWIMIEEFGMFRSTTDHSIFYHHNSSGQCIYLVVYVTTSSLQAMIKCSIQFRCGSFPKEVCFRTSWKKPGMLDCKLVDTPMDPNVKLIPGQGEPLGDPGRYRRLVGKLNYLTITRPDSFFSLARSSAEVEYRAMALATCELIWLKHLLRELRFGNDEQMKLICDSQAALHIASNPVFHERPNTLKLTVTSLERRSHQDVCDRVSFRSPFPSPKLSDQPYRSQKTLITISIFPAIFSGDFSGDFFPRRYFPTLTTSSERKEEICNFSQSTGAKNPPTRHFSPQPNPTRQRVRARGPLSVPSFFQQARPTPSCTSKPLSILLNPTSPFFWHFKPPSSFSLLRPPTAAPFLGQTCVCLGKASSSSPVTFLLCLGPDIPDDKFFMVLTLIGLRPDLESVRDQILASPSVPSLDDVFAHLLRLSSTQTLSTDGPSDSSVLASQTNSQEDVVAIGVEDNVLSAPIVISLVTLEIVAISYMDGLLALPTLLSHLILCYLDLTPLRAPHLRSPSLGPWILDSGASDHISGNKHLFSSITTTSALPTVTLANVPKLWLKDRSTGRHWHRARLGHPSLSKFQKMVPRFSTLSSLACESCQLGKHTRVSSQSDKLSAKATKCIFLGYSRLQKGYRCYSPDTHRYFLSADVTFFEDSPFFLSSKSLPISEVLPLPYISPPSDALSRPLQVYHRRHRVVAPPISSVEVPDDSPPIHRFLLPRPCHLLTICLLLFRKSTSEALSHPGWRQAMVDEMVVLHSNGTWDLVSLPPGKPTVGCHWIYTVKVGPDGQVNRLKARLVAKAMCHWPLYQLDIKNAFLHGELLEEVYMEQPPSFVVQGESGLVCKLRRSLYGLKQSPRAWFGRFNSVVQEFGMLGSEADHSVFYHHNSSSQCIYLVVYVDDIVITGSDQEGIQRLKQHLFNHFQTKDLGKLNYFLGLEIAQSSLGVVISQRKTGGASKRSWEISTTYRQTELPHHHSARHLFSYECGTPGQGMLYEDRGHTQIVGYTNADWAGSPSDRRSTLSDEAEYQAMALATCELIWLRQLLQELRFRKDEQIKLVCDNQVALHIASNPVFHERTKHIEVDCYFIREKIASGCVATSYVNSNDQLADIFTKSLRGPRIKYICNKLGAYDIYAPT